MGLMAKKTYNTSIRKQFYMKKKENQKKSKLKTAISLQSEAKNIGRKKRAKNYGVRERKQGNTY